MNLYIIIAFFLLLFRLTEVSTVPDFQILGTQHSQRAEDDAKYHHLLETAMYDPRRQQIIHKRSQLDEDDRQAYRRPRSMGAAETFHHQKPINLRNLIDPSRKPNDGTRKRSTGGAVSNHATRNKQKTKPNVPPSMLSLVFLYSILDFQYYILTV